jgi:hypothetical protein
MNFYKQINKQLTPRISRAHHIYVLRLAESDKVNLNKNLACGVGCMRWVRSVRPKPV